MEVIHLYGALLQSMFNHQNKADGHHFKGKLLRVH